MLRTPQVPVAPDAVTPANQAMLQRIQRAIAGNPPAVRELVDTLTPTIQGAAVRALLRRRNASGKRDVRQEVADLTQSVFLALFKDGGRELLQWDPSRGSSLPAFIGLLAQREVSSILRSQRRNPFTEDPTETDDFEQVNEAGGPEAETESREMLELIATRMKERLSERGLELFYLLLVDDRSIEEACLITGMKADAVYQWRNRLQKQARQIREEIMSENEAAGRIPKRG
ncbi:RNA polymerase sigma factor [Polyangium aurulentum]|uniref:RNA polymerase sigma factor n=1 Tax=Polyangium aurulentum TaxID=2567896 RepID=UPI0010AE600E|nr:sigma-70 family RNA polymerase sigma factor [Polyangium aurulentum]UQA62785.1 sigma-70 family RNA polymerase sigma factor [Polyangium aurulentum]